MKTKNFIFIIAGFAIILTQNNTIAVGVLTVALGVYLETKEK